MLIPVCGCTELHLKNLTLMPDTDHVCSGRPCGQQSAFLAEYDGDQPEERRKFSLCMEHFRTILLPRLPKQTVDGKTVDWAELLPKGKWAMGITEI
jgi:hypothetical protein